MRHLLRGIRKQARPLVGACALLAAGIGGCVVAGAGTAQAAVCPSTPVAAGTACTDTGSLALTAGFLTMTVPTTMTWAGTDNGLDQLLVDTNVAHQSFIVDDATGSGAGWNVTVSATTFTSVSPAATLPNTNAFAINGALTLSGGALLTTAPTAACTAGATCTPPTDTSVTYPVKMTTAATTPTVYKIYDALLATGLGSITIGLPGANPVGWWVAVPGNAVPSAAYTSTITLEVVTGP